MLYTKPKFTVPVANPQKQTVCKIHHFVKGQCLRCPEKIVTPKPETKTA